MDDNTGNVLGSERNFADGARWQYPRFDRVGAYSRFAPLNRRLPRTSPPKFIVRFQSTSYFSKLSYPV